MAKVMKIGMKTLFKADPIDGVIMTQKEYMDSFSNVVKHVNSASKSLLKWSYTEPNPSLAQAFSCWADLDFAYGKLIQQLCEKGVTYRQVFKDIREQGIELAKVKVEKNKTASDVTKAQNRVESLRKSKKVDQPKIDSAEAELQLAKNKDEETAELLRVKTKEYEEFKAKTVRDALICYSKDYLEVLANIQMIFQNKKEIGEMMNEKPVYAGQELTSGNSKVDDIFQKLELELPMRDAALDRLQINRSVSAPPLRQPSPNTQPKQSHLHSMHEHITKHFPALSVDNDVSDGEDDHEYQYPEESFGSSNPSIMSRTDSTHTGEEEYIVPNAESSNTLPAATAPVTKPDKIENPEHMDSQAVYFEVEENNPAQTRLPPGISTPDVCPVNHPSPPEDTCTDDQYYGNISPEEANKLGLGVTELGVNRNNSQASNVDQPRKPAILPKPKGSSPKPGSSPQVRQKSASVDDGRNSKEIEEEDSGDVYVLYNIAGEQPGTDENCNADPDEGETYDTVCVMDDQIYGNVDFLESEGHMGQNQQHLLPPGQDSSSKGPMPTPRKEKIMHTYFSPERKEEPKRQPPKSPLPSRPK